MTETVSRPMPAIARMAEIQATIGTAQRSSAPRSSATGFDTSLVRAMNSSSSVPVQRLSPSMPVAQQIIEAASATDVGEIPAAADSSGTGRNARFVQAAFAAIGVNAPAGFEELSRLGAEIDGIDDARPGDLLIFGDPPDDVAIYLGLGRSIRADSSGRSERGPIDRPIASVRRLVEQSIPTTYASGAALNILSIDRQVSTFDASQFSAMFEASGARHGVDPGLLAALASVESSFDPTAVSPAGAQGLMQFMPATAAEMGVDPFDPASAIDGAARYLARDIARFGRVDLAVAAYNAGPGAVARYGGIPPFAETQGHVQKVLERWGGTR